MAEKKIRKHNSCLLALKLLIPHSKGVLKLKTLLLIMINRTLHNLDKLL